MLLAIRSPIFKKLLFGDFAEATNSNVCLGFESKVLRVVMQYCYTDEVIFVKETCDAEMAMTVVSIAAAADYFELPKLGKQASDWACEQIRKGEALGLPFLAALGVAPDGACPQIRHCAMEVLRTSFKQNLDNVQDNSLEIMSDAVLASILSDQEIETDEIDLFRLAKAWSEVSLFDGLGGETDKVRKTVASDLVFEHVGLEQISPADLDNDVTASGLASDKMLLQAYRTHALAQTKSPPLKRRGLYWGASKSQVLENITFCRPLSCKPMASGNHIWSIKVLAIDANSKIWLGVAAGDAAVTKCGSLTSLSSTWLYGKWGSQHRGVAKPGVFPTYTAGSVITFTLNLTVGNGRLSAAVDEGPNSILFEDMLQLKTTSDGPPSFVPVASCGNSKVRFESFHPSSFH